MAKWAEIDKVFPLQPRRPLAQAIRLVSASFPPRPVCHQKHGAMGERGKVSVAREPSSPFAR
jgi:hypothetical protein